MIERNKKIIIILSVIFVLTNLVPIPFIIIRKNPDALGISYIIGTLLMLLYWNFRASRFLTKRQKAKYFSEKEKKEDIKLYKEGRNIILITTLVMAIATVVLCIFVL